MPPRQRSSSESLRQHTRWRQRFFLSAGSLLLVNIVLLYLLADSYRRPQVALDRTKADVQLLTDLLAGKARRSDLMTVLKNRRVPDKSIEEINGRINVGGISFVLDDKQQIVKVEHWSLPGGAGTR